MFSKRPHSLRKLGFATISSYKWSPYFPSRYRMRCFQRRQKVPTGASIVLEMHHRGPIFSLLEMDRLGNGYRIGEPGRLVLTYTSCVLLSPSQDLPVMDRYGRTIQPFLWTSASRNRERSNSLSCIYTAGERLLNDCQGSQDMRDIGPPYHCGHGREIVRIS